MIIIIVDLYNNISFIISHSHNQYSSSPVLRVFYMIFLVLFAFFYLMSALYSTDKQFDDDVSYFISNLKMLICDIRGYLINWWTRRPEG